MTKYTLKDIETLWKGYQGEMVLRVLKDGKWQTMQILKGKGIPRITATQAKVVKLKDVMDFPEYLKRIEDEKTT